MLRWLLLGAVLWPLVEIAVLIKVGSWIGVLPTLVLLILAFVGGIAVVRGRGLSLPSELRGALRRGQMPALVLADSTAVFFAGVLLMLPGFVSDAIALLLLIPPVRAVLFAGLARRFVVARTPAYRPTQPGPNRTIELDTDDYRDRNL